MYMQLALLYVALAWAYREVTTRDAPRWPLWLTLLALQVAALYTHYFAAILIAWLLLVAVVETVRRLKDRGRQLKLARLAVVQVLCALAYLPWLGVTLRQLTDHTPRAAEPPDLLTYVSETWRFFNAGVLGMAAASHLFAWASAVAGALFVAVLVVAFARLRHRSGLAVLLAHGLVPLIAVYLIGQGRPGVHPRYVLMAAPPLMMVLAACVAMLSARGAPGRADPAGAENDSRLRASGHAAQVALSTLTVVAFVTAWAVALGSYYGDARFHRDDVRSVAAHVTESAASDDLVLLDYDDHAFRYYYAGPAALHVLDLVRADGDPVERLIGDAPEGARVFSVGWSGGRTDYRDTIPALLERNGRYEGRHDDGPFTVDRYVVGEAAEPIVPPLRSVDAGFGAIAMTGAAAPTTTTAGEALVVGTRWAVPARTDERLKVVVEVHDPFGNRVAHGDTMIHDRLGLTTDLWPAGTESTVYSVVPLPVGSPPGEYYVSVGVYEAREIRDLQLRDEAGAPIGTRTPLTSVAVTADAELDSDPYDTLGRLGLRTVGVPATAEIAVEGVALDSDSIRPGRHLGATILWRADRAPGDVIEPALRLVVDGRPIALDAPSPTLGAHPSDSWQAGERVLDRRRALVPPDVSGASAVLELVVDGRAIALAEMPVTAISHVYEVPAYGHDAGVVFPGVGELVGFSLETEGGCRLELAPGTGSEPETGTATAPETGTETEPELDTAAPRRAALHISDRDTCGLVVTHVWRAEGGTPGDLKVFNHLLDPDRRMIAQHDGPPATGERPTTGWLGGEYVSDQHTLTFAESSMPTGLATLEVGLYDPDTLTRVVTDDGADRAVLDVELTVEPPPGSRH